MKNHPWEDKRALNGYLLLLTSAEESFTGSVRQRCLGPALKGFTDRGQKPSTVTMNLFTPCLMSMHYVSGNVLDTGNMTEKQNR